MSGPSNTRKRSTADTSRSRHRARSSVRWLGITAGVISALLIAACGSSSSSSTASSSAASSGSGTSTAASGTSTTSGSGTCDVAAINAQLAKYNGYPTFSPPGPPITVSKLKGRKIADIPLNSSIQFVNLIDQEMKTVSQSLGIGFNIATNQGQTNQWIQGMNQAVNAKAGAIILSQAPDPKVLQPQIIQAKSAGIPTISTHWYDTEDATDTPANVKAPNLAADVPFRFTTIARLEADWAIAHSNCKAHTIFIYASDSDGHKQMAHAYQQELTSKCGSGCSATLIGLPFSDWPTKLQSDIQSTLAANPSVNWVIPVVDFGVQFALPAINASSKGNGQVKIATFNGTPSVLKELRDGNIVDMEIGENLNWNAYADLDQTFRVMLGDKPVADEKTPIRIFSKANIAETGNPPGYNKGWGNSDFAAGYRHLWGVS